MYRRVSSRRRKPYIPKPMGSRWLADIARKEDAARPEWRERYGDRTVEDVAIMKLRLWVLRKCDGCRKQTAEVLGISRKSLQTHLARYEELGEKVLPPPVDKYRVSLGEKFWTELGDRLFYLGDF